MIVCVAATGVAVGAVVGVGLTIGDAVATGVALALEVGVAVAAGVGFAVGAAVAGVRTTLGEEPPPPLQPASNSQLESIQFRRFAIAA